MTLTRLLFVSTGLAALAGGGLWYSGWLPTSDSSPPIDESRTYVVQRGTLRVTLSEKGTFRAENSAEIRLEALDESKIEWIVDEGSFVQQGQIVVEMDKTRVEDEIKRYENLIIQYESEVKTASTERVIQEALNKTNSEKAELALVVARVGLDKLLEGDIPSMKRALDLDIQTARSEQSRAEDRARANEELYKEDFVTKDQLEEDLIRLRTAQNTLLTAELEKNLYLAHIEPLQEKQARAAVAEGERALESAHKRAEAAIAAKNARVKQKELSLNAALKNLELYQKERDNLTLRAPKSGVLLYAGSNSWRGEEIKVGTELWPGSVIATIPNVTNMTVGIEVHEADIERIRIGMPANVTAEALPGEFFDATVSHIDAVANARTPSWRRSEVNKFAVDVELVTDAESLKPGTSARVEIQVGEAVDVLYVPLDAIHAREGKLFCFADRDDGLERVEVALGRTTRELIEVVDGLEMGDRVLLYDPTPRARPGPTTPKEN